MEEYYQIDLELSEQYNNELRQDSDKVHNMFNLLTEALTTTNGINKLVVCTSGHYIGLEFDDKVQSNKTYHQLKHVLEQCEAQE